MKEYHFKSFINFCTTVQLFNKDNRLKTFSRKKHCFIFHSTPLENSQEFEASNKNAMQRFHCFTQRERFVDVHLMKRLQKRVCISNNFQSLLQINDRKISRFLNQRPAFVIFLLFQTMTDFLLQHRHNDNNYKNPSMRDCFLCACQQIQTKYSIVKV